MGAEHVDAKTVLGVESARIYGINGVEAGSIESITGGVAVASDTFISTCQGTGNLFGLWTCRDATAGDLDNGSTIMSDVSGNDRSALVATLASAGNWQVKADDSGPGSTSPSLQQYVSSDSGTQNTSNFGAAGDSWSQPVTLNNTSDPLFYGQAAGFALFYTPSIHNRTEIVTYFGDDGTPQGTANVLGLVMYSSKIYAVQYGATGVNFSLTHGNSGTSPTADKWLFIAWRLYNSSGPSASANKFEGFVQEVGSNWGTNQQTWDVSPACDPCTSIQTGLRFGYNTTGTPPAGIAWAAHATFTGDVTESTFQSIYEAAGLGAH